MTKAEDKGPAFGMRHAQALLLFLNIVAIYISRLNIGVAVVAMTNAETTNPDFPEFDWSEKEISYILSSFFWGYVLTQLPGGALCKRFGAKIVMGLSTFISAVLSAITPWCVGWGSWQAFCAIRVIQGVVQGVLFPCIFDHLAKWCPLKERNRLGAFSQTGIDCGTVLALGISGFIAAGPMGWPGISYISAAVCFLWCLLWLIFGANNVCESKFATEAERHYIESSMAHTEDFHQKKIAIPWRAIFTSMPFLILLIARCSHIYGLSTLQSQIPSYLNGVLNMDIKSNALNSSMPFMASWAVSYLYLFAGDFLQQKDIWSLTAIRKVFNSFAFWIPAIGLVIIGFLDEDNKAWALTLMVISVAANSGNVIGSSLNSIDLSPNHAGFLMSVLNTAASVMSLLAPLIVGFIVTDGNMRTQWQIVFAIAAAVFFLGNLVYVIWGTTDTQPWNDENFLLPKDAEHSNGEEKHKHSFADAMQKPPTISEKVD
ncbi:putative inorganic phosphate cotransporter [Stomoxys calcitrans]|uniref:putative inorganic phosphate cotransporter n=1 Tax=Stomoxys calcitrans TaxID=35570 RepID=UPI0027E2A34B|nr:putative inorganic phosphate cotransporter [Stomoxys calcitrans]